MNSAIAFLLVSDNSIKSAATFGKSPSHTASTFSLQRLVIGKSGWLLLLSLLFFLLADLLLPVHYILQPAVWPALNITLASVRLLPRLTLFQSRRSKFSFRC